MTAARAIPEGLASMAPGPLLAALLASIDVAEVSGFDAVVVLKARHRQVAYEQGQLFGALVEVGLRDEFGPEIVRMEYSDQFAADEIRAALALTRSAANWQLEFAERVVLRVPVVHAGMLAGVVDWAKAQLLTSWTLSLSEEHARKICERLVPLCDKLTTGQIREKLKTHATALDPEWAQRRYEAALLGRRVVGGMNEDGTANLSGYGMPPERVRAACARIDALARRAKREGDRRPIDYVKVELFLGMTDGTYEGLSDEEILVHLALSRPAPGERPAPDADEAEHSAPEPAPEASEPAPVEPAPVEPAPVEPAAVEPAAVEVRVLAPVSPERRLEIARREPPRHGVELRVRLSTLLNLDQFPGELAGHGPIHPAHARDLAADLGAAQWRYVLTDHEGRYFTSGLVTARPTGAKRRSWRSQALVELQIPISLLADLVDSRLTNRQLSLSGAWDAVVADIARRTDMQPGAPPTRDRKHGTDDPRRRFPNAALRRAVQIRKRRCVGPGCRAPASTTDIDHVRDHAKGGPTLDWNLDPNCRHDHTLKHKGRWTLRAIGNDKYLWTSRLGHTYRVDVPPIIEDLPDPDPASDQQEPTSWPPRPGRGADGKPWPQSTTWVEPPPKPEPEPEPEPPAPKPPPDENEIPPF